MFNEGAPEFVVDQSMYYPAPTNYGFYCTGFESPGEWEDYPRIFGVEGPDIQYTGAQDESFPYVYFTPSYGFAQSPYNPYNPYIPGAMMGVDGSFGGAQQYYSLPSYQNPVSAPAYVPHVQSEHFHDSSVDPLFDNSASVNRPDGRGTIHKFSSASAAFTMNSSKPLSNQTSSLVWEPERPRADALAKKDLTNGTGPNSGFPNGSGPNSGFPNGSGPNSGFPNGSGHNSGFPNFASSPYHQARSADVSFQPKDTFSNGNVLSHRNQLNVAAPMSNGFSDYGLNATGQSAIAKFRPKVHAAKVPGDLNRGSDVLLGELNRGPRTSRPKHHMAIKAYTTKAGDANTRENIIYTDQYNREDFPIDNEIAKFFVIKSYSEDDVHKSIKYNVWSSTPHGNKKLQSAYEDARRKAIGKSGSCPIFLFFSVNASGQFCGVAEMVGPVDFDKDMDFWQQDKWSGSFPVKWHIIKDVPNTNFRHIVLENNEFKPVTNSRDTQEIMYRKGLEVLKIFKNYTLKTSLLDDFMYYENRQKVMQEEKAKFLSKNFGSSLSIPASEPPQKLTYAFEIPPVSDEKNSKADDLDSLKHTSISSVGATVNSSCATSNASVDEKAETGEVVSQDISSVLKIGSVTITPKQVPIDVVTVGSMQVKVNGFSESSGVLKVGSTPLDSRSLLAGKGTSDINTGPQP
ncbi:unnamed protein product [Vicia faba]|uniref:YTH domain-containing family protein n=1 Tax=Vicia faba TaxID=3906 RepID=A0AAV1AN68_VICFA|nr:unnamed protein product [Vicia faba]